MTNFAPSRHLPNQGWYSCLRDAGPAFDSGVRYQLS